MTTSVRPFNDMILSAFCEAGNSKRFDVAQLLLRALGMSMPSQHAEEDGQIDAAIAVYGHLQSLVGGQPCRVIPWQNRRPTWTARSAHH